MEGKFKAKPINGGFGKTKNGTLLAIINFRVSLPEEEKEYSWEFPVSEKSLDTVLKSVMACGYTGSNLDDFANGKGLDKNVFVEVDIQREVFVNDKGEEKSKLKIKWVNPINSGKEILAASDTIMMLKGLNIEASMMALRMKTGMTAKKPDFTAGEIPF
jgi:hypothetical protein